MTRIWTTLALGLAATSPAFAQSAGSDSDKNTNSNHDTSNQAGPTETNTNSSGTTPQGDVNDRTGTDVNNPSDATAPTNEQVPTTTNPTTTTNTTTNYPQTTTTAPATTDTTGYVSASTRDTTYVRTSERERMGLTIAAGGGTSGFTSTTLRDSTNTGGDWDVRLTIGSRSPLAFEASYIGSAQRISGLGVNSNSMLVGNGAQGALRLNLTTDLAVQPFIFGGAAWRRYTLTNNSNNTSDVANKDDVMEFPVGAGIAGKFMGLVLDARGEFRYTTNADLIATSGEPTIGVSNSGTLHRWGVNANIGYEF